MQKGFVILWILLGIMVIAGIAGGAYFLGNSQAPKSQNPIVTSQTPKPALIPSPSPDEISLIRNVVIKKDQDNYRALGSKPPTGEYQIDIINTPDKFEEKYSSGRIHQAGVAGGAIWVAAKINDRWEIAFMGNGLAKCEEISPYNLPIELMPTCVDKKNNVIER